MVVIMCWFFFSALQKSHTCETVQKSNKQREKNGFDVTGVKPLIMSWLTFDGGKNGSIFVQNNQVGIR